jgi:hypothetical protein
MINSLQGVRTCENLLPISGMRMQGDFVGTFEDIFVLSIARALADETMTANVHGL